MLVIVFPSFPLMFSRYKGVWFWELIKRILEAILWPLKQLFEILNISQWPIEYHRYLFFLTVIYLFTVGFLIGVTVSYLVERIRRKPVNRTESDFNKLFSE